jgi:signal peptidase II
MLCFVFAALVVVLDQFFKHWVMLTLELGGKMDIVPGIIELTHVQNNGAAFSILSDQRWLLAGISFLATVVLIFILMRYTEGFWGSLGLAAVLGGTAGNLIDRVFQGYVVDMFNPLFVDFAVFNIADIFLTLGFATFCIHFIISSVKLKKHEKKYDEPAIAEETEDDDPYSVYDIPGKQEIPDFDDFSVSRTAPIRDEKPYNVAKPEYPENIGSEYNGSEHSEPDYRQQDYYYPKPEMPEELTSALDVLESELGLVEDYDTDELLLKYGFVNGDGNADSSS